jgi:hypothetical protein
MIRLRFSAAFSLETLIIAPLLDRHLDIYLVAPLTHIMTLATYVKVTIVTKIIERR